MKTILKIIIGAGALLLIDRLIPQSMDISGFYTAALVSLLIGISSITIRPVLLLLSLPITLITFGLFALIIDAALLILIDRLVTGFTVSGFGYAVLVAFILAVVKYVSNKIL